MKRVLSLILSVLLAVTLFSCANPVSDDLYYVAPTTFIFRMGENLI